MGEIVNLRRVKKARQREAEAAAAQENRVRHGRPAAEKANDDRERRRMAERTDGARLSESSQSPRLSESSQSPRLSGDADGET